MSSARGAGDDAPAPDSGAVTVAIPAIAATASVVADSATWAVGRPARPGWFAGTIFRTTRRVAGLHDMPPQPPKLLDRLRKAPLAMEDDEAARPPDIRLFGARAVMPQPHGVDDGIARAV
jgi:hypothetical protein